MLPNEQLLSDHYCAQDLPSLQEMIDRKESSDFYHVFLCNKMHKLVETALVDEQTQLREQELPPHFELFKSICLKMPRFLRLNFGEAESDKPMKLHAIDGVLHESKLLAAQKIQLDLGSQQQQQYQQQSLQAQSSNFMKSVQEIQEEK